MVIEVKSAQEFDQHISSGKLVVVDFFATWCGPCRFVAPQIEELSKTFTNVVFLKVDVDVLSDVAAKNEISAMPTFQFFKNGKKVDEVVGADAKRVESTIKKHL